MSDSTSEVVGRKHARDGGGSTPEPRCGACATKKQRVDLEKKIESVFKQSRIVRNISSRHTNIINRLLNRQTKCASNRNFGHHELMFGAVHATPKHLSCGTLTRSKRSNSKFKIVGVLDTHDPKALVEQKLCYLMHRSDIVEVASSANLIFVLNSTGICTAFDRFTMKRVCFLNISVDQVIRSLFYNKTNDSITSKRSN